MIHTFEDGTCVISSHHVWLPGSYADVRAARYAFRFSDAVLSRLRDRVNRVDKRSITFEDLHATLPPKLTRAQREVLTMLARDDCQTSRCTWGMYVGGRTASALVHRGLAKMQPETLAGERFYSITQAGLDALSP